MKKLILFTLILSVGIASATSVTAIGNASTNSATNWSPAQPNCTSDTIITGAFTVTVPPGTSCTFGSSASGVGIGVNVSAAGGKFVCTGATSVTFKGFDTTTNKAFDVVANATMDLSNCPFLVGQPSDLGATPRVNGNIITTSTTTGDTADAIVWSNASGNNSYVSRVSNPLVNPPNIYVIKMENATQTDPGPVSNSAGTGLGSFGNTSMHFTSGGFDSNGGTVRNEKNCSTVFATPFVDVSTILTVAGDFCIDYDKGMLYYKGTSSVLSVVFDFKFATWFGWSIIAQNNAANSAVTLDGTYSHMGSVVNGNAEFTGGGWMIGDKYAPGLTDATRTLTIGTSLVFNYSSRPLQIYCQNITCSDATHHIVISGATFNNNRYGAGVYQGQGGMIHLGYMNYVDVTNPRLNSATGLFDILGRSNSLGQKNIIVSGATGIGTSVGHVFTMNGALPGLASNSTFTTGNIAGFQNPDLLLQNMDGAFVTICGNATDGANTYSNSTVLYAYRAGRLDEYCSVSHMDFGKTNHHGFVFASRTGFFNCANITFSFNDTWAFSDSGNFPGGITLGYNQYQWIDSCTFDNGTYEGGTRTLKYNDEESSLTAITRFKARNNIWSNSLQGAYLPASGATSNVVNLGVTQEDYNDDYQNNTNPTNVKQGTFMFGGVNYNSSGSKTAVGAYIYNPSYSLPDATNRSLVETVTGTLGAAGTKQIAITWGGGAAVNMLATITGGGATSSTITAFAAGTSGCPDGVHNCPIITDTAAAFPTTGTKLGTYFFMLTSGACSGKVAMIFNDVTNTDATHQTMFSNTSTGSFAACTPAAGDSYIIVKPHQQVFDSGAVQSIFVQMYPPDLLPSTNTTYTDANITIAKNYPGTSGANNGVNPNYGSASTGNLHPTNVLLHNTGIGGIDIGAFSVVTGCGSGITLTGVGCN